jgi:hypothetical protein
VSATAYDTVLYVRQGTCGAGAELGCNDDTAGCGTASGPNHGSRLTPTVTAGQTYFIVVDGYGTAGGGFQLVVSPPGAATTTTTSTTTTSTTSTTSTTVLACSVPTVIPAAGGVFAGTTAGASSLAGTCGSTGTAPERVFQWTPSTSGPATIQTCSASGTTYDTVLYLRQGTCTGGSEVGCNDDTAGCTTASGPSHGSRVTPTVTAGETYFIVVDGYASRAGSFELSVIPPP